MSSTAARCVQVRSHAPPLSAVPGAPAHTAGLAPQSLLLKVPETPAVIRLASHGLCRRRRRGIDTFPHLEGQALISPHNHNLIFHTFVLGVALRSNRKRISLLGP